MGRIQVLPANVANQIAAGEVVVRPASCVKELLENAIDAGAKNITINIEDAGKKLIEIKDDGCGMDETDAVNSFLRHATSKITAIKDLDSIQTLGFRGEALASIASVSRMEMITRTPKDEAATRILFENGKIQKNEKAAANPGTIIRVRDLFYNTPARLKFLKSKYTEEAQIIDTVMSQGLSKEGVSIKLYIDGRETVVFPPAAGFMEKVRAVFGNETHGALMEIGEYTDNIKITGFICAPSVTKNNRSGQFMFVNGRVISSRALSYAVYEGYGTLLMKGNYPVTFIFIDINPSFVDVNVHPTKAEVKFRNEHDIYVLIKKAVENTLAAANLTRSAYADVFDSNPQTDGYKAAVGEAVNSFFSNEPQQLFSSPLVSGPREDISFQSQPQRRQYFNFRFLGQVNLTYIVGEEQGNLVIIDQHAAHEKVLFEEIMKEINSGKVRIQEMLIPEVVEMTPAEKITVENNMEVFTKMGIELEPFGGNAFGIRAHPVIIKNKAIGNIVKAVVDALKEKGTASADEAMKDAAATMACRAAYKAGDALNQNEIEALLSRYFEIDAPFSCPHGRPPIVKIGFEEIEKMFKRKL
ncbi:MAG: DNA mismatch repair endonuclease MutL [Candidatus Goldbacteria bacterium]|nr:DNA mismatch repair endonuclease MutL [Candidatus Goldiibacteriota bacterium]